MKLNYPILLTFLLAIAITPILFFRLRPDYWYTLLPMGIYAGVLLWQKARWSWLSLLLVPVIAGGAIYGVFKTNFNAPIWFKVKFKREVAYKMFDFGIDDMPRFAEELKKGNKRMFTLDENNETVFYYVTKEEYGRICPESPYKMQDACYGFKVTLEGQPLLLGGYQDVKMIAEEWMGKAPVILKDPAKNRKKNKPEQEE